MSNVGRSVSLDVASAADVASAEGNDIIRRIFGYDMAGAPVRSGESGLLFYLLSLFY